MIKAIILTGIIFLAGCSTITNPDNELRVTEYGANGSYLTNFDGKVAGVRVVTKGKIDGCLEYKGPKAKYQSIGCSQK